ncbi:ubiquitin recognition factor in ER-associated degradation protein 1 isoform X1 [Emys orbicularis]|uniref:ubiquitin recognition factor in ER-associated degradation protein 1 isoform X1 n=1 Tax=Emys orbicularis TaxID=82168 RepID=UPI0031FBA7D2
MFSFNMFDHPIPRVFQNRFSTQYRCFSVSMLAGPNDRSDVEKGGKIIMPPSALDQLSRLNITYPMLFKLTNKNSDRMTHCGVLEFVADEGICYLPHWMMQNLLLEEGGLVQVESVNLQVATYSKFQPQSPDFLDITNPKAVLENALRNFACLTTGDVIAINYNEKIYELRVMETKPDKAVSIIECDMNVDFDAPLGYKEPERHTQPEESTDVEADHSGYVGDLGFRVSIFFWSGSVEHSKLVGKSISWEGENTFPATAQIQFLCSGLLFYLETKMQSNRVSPPQRFVLALISGLPSLSQLRLPPASSCLLQVFPSQNFQV